MMVLTNRDVVPDDADIDPAAYPDSPMFTPWACGLIDKVGSDDNERCIDIIPELMVELI